MPSERGNRLGLEQAGSRDAKRKACDVCKRRKVRCNGEHPCQNCVRNGVICEYTLSHGRLAQAERRVARLQERLHLFENAWKAFVPGVELSFAIESIEGQDSPDLSSFVPKLEHEQFRTDVVVQNDSHDSSHPIIVDNEQLTNDQSESEHEDADALTWDESAGIDVVSDGIGSLAMNSGGIGYMGPQSGNALLRNLQSISALYFSPADDLVSRQHPNSEVSETVLNSWSFRSQCVDWYFKHYHTAYPILHEGYFRAQLLGALPKPKDGSWPVLLHTVLAIGARSGDACDQNADVHFYREAARHMSWDVLQRGTLSLVQAFALLANYLQKRDRPNSGFTLLGVAMNMAQGIGLHRELSGPTISAFAMEVRRRVWWTLFIFDSGARLTFGRPTLDLCLLNPRG